MLFDRICRENASTHRLAAPRSPTTTGKLDRFDKTLRVELLGWAIRPSPSRPAPAERFTVQAQPALLHSFCEGVSLKTIPRSTSGEVTQVNAHRRNNHRPIR